MALRPWELLLLDSPEAGHQLWEAKSSLATTWKYDCESPKLFPINTSFAVAEIVGRLRAKTPGITKTKLARWKTPKTLAGLLPEESVKSVWEDFNIGSFEETIKLASEVRVSNIKESQMAFRTILRAIKTSYEVSYLGVEMLARTKVSILHSGLDRIAKAAGLEGQTKKGFAGFLDDLCPCGLNNHAGAVRQLSRRSTRMRRPSSRKGAKKPLAQAKAS
jgi:hypothetical protein